jgi:hypothetical protein
MYLAGGRGRGGGAEAGAARRPSSFSANGGVERWGSLATSIFFVCIAFVFVCMDGKWVSRAVARTGEEDKVFIPRDL